MLTNRTLLIVDDEPNVISSLKRLLRKEDFIIFSAGSGSEGLSLLNAQDVGVVISDMMMPGMDGVTFLNFVKERKPDTVRLLLTGHGSMENAVNAINQSKVFEYLTKPWEANRLITSLHSAFEHYNLTVENQSLQRITRKQNTELKIINKNLDQLVKERTLDLKDAIQEGIYMLALAAEAKDNDTGDHVNRIKNMTLAICLELGMSDDESEKISYASIMHDVGKIHIPDQILKKPGKLTRDEWLIMKSHTIAGEIILGNKPFYKTAREIARNHHERWDGTGYPDGLKKQAIPLSARIVAVADVYDALTHARIYKTAWLKEKAIKEMIWLSGKTFDPDILNIFLAKCL